MSGHSKWATIKHKKAALDAKRGKMFTRIIKEIMIAARAAAAIRTRTRVCAPPSSPPRRSACPPTTSSAPSCAAPANWKAARSTKSCSKATDRAARPCWCNVATDNRNRTVSEIRHVFSKNGGNLGEQGSVAWMFERKSQIVIDGDKATEDQLMDLVLEAGAEDLRDDGEQWEVLSAPEAHEAVLEAIQKAGIPTESSRDRHGSQEPDASWKARTPRRCCG